MNHALIVKSNEQNPYYFDFEGTKNFYNSIKSANKIRKRKHNYICINKDKWKTFISSDEELCILNCTKEYENFDNRTGNSANCDDYISNDNKICLDFCKINIQLFNNIMLNKLFPNENLYALYKQFTNSNNINCIIYFTNVFKIIHVNFNILIYKRNNGLKYVLKGMIQYV